MPSYATRERLGTYLLYVLTYDNAQLLSFNIDLLPRT